MSKEKRTICYDNELKLEAYRLEGIIQPFPNHFHNHYVIGFVEEGSRLLKCKGKEYNIKQGNIIIFNPNDNHSCVQNNNGIFSYIGLNIQKDVMQSLTEEITGNPNLTIFSENVIENEEISHYFSLLHKMIMENSKEFEKEELLLLLIQTLLEQYGLPFDKCAADSEQNIESVCVFIQQHFNEHLTLNQLCECSNMSKSTLLRTFTKYKGVTPYRYLQTIRIEKAKKLLEKRVSPVDAALQTGFSDQSHFSHFFNMFIGLSPAAYKNIFKEKQGKRQNEK